MANHGDDKRIEANLTKKQRKRTVFDLEQVHRLEQVFDQITHYPDVSLRQHLSGIVGLPDKKIQVEFLTSIVRFSTALLIDLVSKSSCKMA